MSDKPEALLISPVVPNVGGRAMRTYAWLQTLQQRYRVHLWTADLNRVLPRTDLASFTEQLGVASIDVLPPVRKPRRLQRMWAMLRLSVAIQQPYLRTGWIVPERDAVVAMAARCGAASIGKVVVYRMYMDGVAECLRPLPAFQNTDWVIDLDDLESAAKGSMGRRMLAKGQWRRGAYLVLAGRQFAALETVVPRRYHTVHLAAHEDAEDLRQRCPGLNVQVFANRIPRTDRLPASTQACWTMLFAGSLSYYQNQDAVYFLLDEILPELRRRLSAPWRLIIAGGSAPAWMRARCAQQANVELVDSPADMHLLYARAHVALAPLRCGGGTRLKLIEAFALGRPVIGTANSVRGLFAQPDVHYAQAEDAGAYATQVIRLMTDASHYDAIAAGGRSIAERHFL
jgi:polysaccharide biosynthesis protein PslH